MLQSYGHARVWGVPKTPVMIWASPVTLTQTAKGFGNGDAQNAGMPMPCHCITVTPPLPFPNGKSPWNEVGATRRVESADSSYYFKRWFLPNIRIQDVRNSAIQKQLIFSSPQSKEIMRLCNTLLKHYSWSRPKTRHDFLQKDTSLRQQIINFITVLIGSYFQKRE